MTNPRRPLEVNVGFLVSGEVGTTHEFSFDFEKIQLGDDLVLTDFLGTVTFSRTQQGLIIQGQFSARTEMNCVRCLEPYTGDMAWSLTDLFAFDQRSMSDSDLLVPEEGRIDLAPLLREYALLEIPIQPICRADCKGLCPQCGGNLNQADCGHRPEVDGSPFSALKDLIK